MEVNQAGPEAPNSKSLSLVGINSPSLLYLLSEDLESWAVEERRATDLCLQGKWTFAAERPHGYHLNQGSACHPVPPGVRLEEHNCSYLKKKVQPESNHKEMNPESEHPTGLDSSKVQNNSNTK